MKIFKFRFTRVNYGLIFAGLALAVAAFGVNTYFVISEGISSAANVTYPIIQYSVTYLISVLLFVVLIGLLVSSYYSVDEKYLKTCFGIIRSKYDVKAIETITLDRATNKLSVSFENNTFIVIVVREEWYEDFVEAILKANPAIEYAIRSKESDRDDDEKKKK